MTKSRLLLVRVLPAVCAILVAAGSFALSFVALRDVATRTDAVPVALAWLVPICVDGAVLAASATAWAASLRGQRIDKVAIVTATTLLIVSVVINAEHAGPSVLAKVIASIPPLSLLATLELVAGAVRRDVNAARAKAATEVAAQTATETVLETAHAQASVAASVDPVTAAGGDPAAAPAGRPDVVEAPRTHPHTTLAPASATSRPAAAAEAAPAPAVAPVTVEATEAPAPASSAAQQPAARPAPRPAPAKRPAPARRGEATVADRVAELLAAHTAAGGDPLDASLARTFAATLEVNPATVRKALGPLRREAVPAS